MRTINFLKVDPPRTCWWPACHGCCKKSVPSCLLVPASIAQLNSGNYIFISLKLSVKSILISSKSFLNTLDFRTAFTIIASWQKLPDFLLSYKYFQETKLFAETRNWHAKYCLVISDICFQSLHADRKFWSHRYFFLLLCTHISGNTGYLDGEIFLPYRMKKNLSKSWSQWKDQLNRCIEVCRRQFRKLLN